MRVKFFDVRGCDIDVGAAAFEAPAPAVVPRTRLLARTAAAFAQGWRLNRETGLEAAVPSEWAATEIDVEIPRTADAPGLGIVLEEFGGRLTLVDELVAGGNAAAAGADLLPGDTIVRADAAVTEGLDYDDTVAALGRLPPAPAPARLRIKRLVRLPAITARVMFPPDEGEPDRVVRLVPGRQIRGTLLKQGVPMGPCGDDLQCCLTCGMLVRKGRALLEPAKTQEAQMLRREPNWRLACRSVCLPCEEDAELVIRIRPDTENILRPKDPYAWRT